MPGVSFTGLFVVVLIALGAPLVLGLAPAVRIPSVVLEIIAGVVVGPSVLGLVRKNDLPLQIVALLGLAFLLFLAGLEIDVRRLRGRLLRLALMGYLITIALGVAAGLGFSAAGWVKSPILIAITLSATSLGLVVAVLKDAGRTETEVGQTIIGASSVADFSAVVLLSLLFSSSRGSVGGRVVLLSAFAALVIVTGVVVSLAGRSMRVGDVLERLQDTTAEIRVRAAVVLLIAFVALAARFGLETILGAFLAGGVVGVVDKDNSSHPRFRAKLDAIGYGFLIPVFFIFSGVGLDLKGLLASPSALARVPVFLVALLVVRGVPAVLFRRSVGSRPALAAGLLQATSLPFIVAATQIGVVTGLMRPVTAAALVCAGLLSVLLFPVCAVALLRGDDERGDDERGAMPAGQEVPQGRPGGQPEAAAAEQGAGAAHDRETETEWAKRGDLGRGRGAL